MRLFLLRFGLLAVIVILFAGLGCKGDTVISPQPVGGLVGINIYDVPSTLAPGQVVRLGATGLYPGGATYDVTGLATWISSDPYVIQITGGGWIRAAGGGTATISCSYRGASSMSVMISVEGPPAPGYVPPPEPVVLSQIQIEPTYATVQIGETEQFEATAIYSNGSTQPVTNLVDWRVSTNDYGFIIDAENTTVWGPNFGLFRAVGPIGTLVVSCEYQGIISNYVTVVIRVYP